MRVICHLRELRGERKLREISEASGVAIAALSMIERGRTLPRDADVPQLENAYGAAASTWYSPTVLLALAEDGE